MKSSDHLLINAIREVLGLAPLYSTKRVRPEIAWAQRHQFLALSSGIDWDSDQIVAEDGTRTIPMRDRIHAQVQRALRRHDTAP